MRNQESTAGSPPKKFRYRIHPVAVRDGSSIRAGYSIQSREVGSRSWNRMVAVGEKPVLYYNKATAERHCAWLNDPVGTEPQWGRDDATDPTVMEAIP